MPVKWIETRREHLLTTAHAREQWHDIELAARRDGTILGMRAEVLADLGAYARSLGVLCPSITAASLPGPYRFRNYACHVRVALTSKAPAATRVKRSSPSGSTACRPTIANPPPTKRRSCDAGAE